MKKLLAILAVLLLGISPTFAATTPNSFITPQVPNRGLARFVQGTDAALTPKTLYTAGANGSRCYMIWASTNDSVAHPVTITITNAATLYTANTVNVPSGAGGSAGVPSVNLMWSALPIDQYGNFYIQIVSGDTLQAYFSTAFVSGGSVVAVVATCWDY
jgi:hypothetical protein